MAKIIYSSYTITEPLSPTLKHWGKICVHISLGVSKVAIVLGIIAVLFFIFTNLSTAIFPIDKLVNMLLFIVGCGIALAIGVPALLTFFICLFLFAVLIFALFSSLHIIMTNEKIYLYTIIFPFIIRKINLTNIAFIRIKTDKSKQETERLFIIHLHNKEQLVYAMPLVNDDKKLKEKLESLGITTVIYEFPAKAST